MTTDFYRPTTDLMTTISMSIASCLAFSAPHVEEPLEALVPAGYTVGSPAWINQTASFYTAAAEPPDEAAQLAALENFASRLLGETVEPPQAVVDLLNERFWDLV